MEASVVLLALGVLCGFWDAAFGVRNWQGGATTLTERLGFAWRERRLTIVGSALVFASVVVELVRT